MNTKNMLRQNAKPEGELQKEFEDAARRLKNAELVEVFIPEAYRSAFGNPFEFSVNAVTISVPIGKKVKIPAPHATHLQVLMKGAVTSKNQKRLTPEELYND